ncbi:DedA family protein [Conexibacter sp. DBS9H8]|uniref:DedA family protein n=1 Tax=Conexibacter sp. DBS9H8 TaxID=2937801 RepID=UPI00200E20DF|nr:DedA family protein [Conexibacter sp. DBS9H8]
MLLAASVTEALATFATHLITHLGEAGIFGLTLFSAFFILPGTEVTMLFGGFNVDEHHLTLLGIVVFASIADILGAVCVYWIGYFGLHEVLNRLPGPLNVSSHGLDRAHAWFERWGIPAVALSRVVPTVRAGGPWAAGVAHMPFWRYFAAMAAGTIVWMLGLGLLGEAVGSQWSQWKSHLGYVDYAAVVLIVAGIVWLLYARVYKPRAAARSHAGVDL